MSDEYTNTRIVSLLRALDAADSRVRELEQALFEALKREHDACADHTNRAILDSRMAALHVPDKAAKNG